MRWRVTSPFVSFSEQNAPGNPFQNRPPPTGRTAIRPDLARRNEIGPNNIPRACRPDRAKLRLFR